MGSGALAIACAVMNLGKVTQCEEDGVLGIGIDFALLSLYKGWHAFLLFGTNTASPADKNRVIFCFDQIKLNSSQRGSSAGKHSVKFAWNSRL